MCSTNIHIPYSKPHRSSMGVYEEVASVHQQRWTCLDQEGVANSVVEGIV